MATMATASKLAQPTHLIGWLHDAYRITDELFGILHPDALYERPIAERHRIIFYIGHLEAFDWNLFSGERPHLKSFHPEYDKLFAFGIDPVEGGLPTDQPRDWPFVGEVHEYRDAVRKRLDSFLDSQKFAEPDDATTLTPLAVLLLTAIEHRLMHAETLAYMFHRLPFHCKIPQKQVDWRSTAAAPQMIEIPSGTATLGLQREAGHGFGWDNEFEAHAVHVPSYHIDKFMVTNAQYMQFVLDGGYRESRFWAPADWAWITEKGIGQPAFWIDDGNSWLYRGMFEPIAQPLDCPVYVSHAEASAYARWAGKALPTEAQWHRAAYGEPNGSERNYPWGSDEHFAHRGNFDFARWDAAPVHSSVNNESAFGAVGMLGNGWEWTASVFAPFPGFQAFSFYPGYSANFFDGKHFVMKGGCSRTAAALLRQSFRNWFQPHYQYVYAGFRCVSSGD
jgi:gamma-glutamyl hercynylcysteine S-oxide synthase